MCSVMCVAYYFHHMLLSALALVLSPRNHTHSDVLPLVEFEIEDGISEEEVVQLINADSVDAKTVAIGGGDKTNGN